MKNNQMEYRLQCHIWKMHQRYFPHVMFTHIANETRNAADAYFNKQKGTQSGVSDILISWIPDWITDWRGLHYGLKPRQTAVIEVKPEKGRVQSSQNKWLSSWGRGGYQGIARSWEAYYKLLCSWGIKPKEECKTFIEPDYSTKQEKFQAAHDMYAPEVISTKDSLDNEKEFLHED